jgi:hypothetical protein
MAGGAADEGKPQSVPLTPRRRRSVNGLPKVRSHHIVFISLIDDHKIRGADPGKAVPEIEIDCPAVFGFDLQPGVFAADAPAMFQGMTQQRAAPSARLVPRLNIQGPDFQRRTIGQWGRSRRTNRHETINSGPVLRYPDRQIGIADRVAKLCAVNSARTYSANNELTPSRR